MDQTRARWTNRALAQTRGGSERRCVVAADHSERVRKIPATIVPAWCLIWIRSTGRRLFKECSGPSFLSHSSFGRPAR